MILRNKITFSVLLVFSGLCFAQAINTTTNQEIYPFTNNPQVSWNEFERDFRIRYKHLDVPPFRLIKDTAGTKLDFGPAAYVHEVDENWQELCAKNSIDSQLPVVIVDTREITTSDFMGYTLLHEIGHHYSDSKVRNQKKDKAASVRMVTSLALLAGNGAYLCHSCNSILNKTFTAKKGLTQLLLGSLLLFKNEIFGQFINNFMITRSEEYFADNFANQHATVEMMQAAEHFFSVEGSIENYMHEKHPKEKWDTMSLKEQEDTRIAVNFTISAFYSLFDTIDIASHPSNKKRHDLVQKALKERFGIENN